MALFKVHKVTSLPGVLEANAVYVVANPATPEHVEIHVATNDGSKARRIHTEADINALIVKKASAIAETKVVENIGELADLPETVLFAYAKDASTDSSVTAGGALYIRSQGTNTNGVANWTKITETESMDFQVNWDSIQGKPTSSTSSIDNAVTKAHQHTNMTQLEKIGETGNNLTYNGQIVATQWVSTDW